MAVAALLLDGRWFVGLVNGGRDGRILAFLVRYLLLYELGYVHRLLGTADGGLGFLRGESEWRARRSGGPRLDWRADLKGFTRTLVFVSQACGIRGQRQRLRCGLASHGTQIMLGLGMASSSSSDSSSRPLFRFAPRRRRRAGRSGAKPCQCQGLTGRNRQI